MSAHQCPRCELKFSFRTEVEAHLATDHRPVQQPADAGKRDDTAVAAATLKERNATAAVPG